MKDEMCDDWMIILRKHFEGLGNINKIEFNLDLLAKTERGLRTERVRVTRNGKVFYREQRVGRKEEEKKRSSGRLGTGKIASLPDEIRNEILEQRKVGTSGAKIKEIIENMIDAKPEMRPRLEEKGLINSKGKLTITGQALTDWAKVRGVEPAIKRQTGLKREKEAHQETKKYADKLRNDLSRAQVENKELREKIKQLEASKKESDEIRDRQRKDILKLRSGKKDVKEDVTTSKDLVANQQKKIKELYDEINKRDQKIKEAEKENMKLRGRLRDIEIMLERMKKKENKQY